MSPGLVERIKSLIRDVPDFPKPGIVFKDLTTVFLDGAASGALSKAFADRYRDRGVDAFVAIESRGFVVGSPVAVALEAGLVLIRKPGKLPAETIAQSYDLEYGSDTLEMHVDALGPGKRVVIFDDLLATGGTARAACDLVRQTGAEVIEAAFVVELGFLKGRARLDGVPCFSVVRYD